METPVAGHQTPPVIQHFLVAYLDVLGQRDRLRELTALPRNNDEIRETAAILKGTLGFVLQLRSLFEKFFEGYSKRSDFVQSLSETEQQTFRELSRTEVHLYGFSDSFVVYVPLRSDDEHSTPMNGVFAALMASAAMPINSLYAGHSLRGGIDVGVGVQLDTGEVYGAALERAYTLEHDVSDYPRITVGDELIRYLQFVRDQQSTSIPGRCAKQKAELCCGFYLMTRMGK